MKSIDLPPLEVMIEWPQANYINPETRGRLLDGLLITFILVTCTIVSLRMYIRIVTRTLWYDDVAMLLAIPFTIAMVVLTSVPHWGKHVWDLPIPDVTFTLKCLFATEVTSTLSHYLTKLSILLFYQRLFGPCPSPQRLVKIGYLMIALFGPLTTLIVIFQCLPVRAFWELALQPLADDKENQNRRARSFHHRVRGLHRGCREADHNREAVCCKGLGLHLACIRQRVALQYRKRSNVNSGLSSSAEALYSTSER